MLERMILLLTLLFLLFLFRESWRARRDRRRLQHVVHVNGTRGKSTVCRLIDAGLRSGGLRVFCKTTGTVPMVIGTDGLERPLKRRGPANIREQLSVLHAAAAENAQVLVVECMALIPELQYTAQHKMLRADIGVITNVRHDHTEIMGSTPEEICDALSNTIPENGVLFTGECRLADRLAGHASALNTEFISALPDGTEPELDFAENVALALSVCVSLGVDRAAALGGMLRFRPDPYAVSVYRVGEGLFINAMSANDPQSTRMVWDSLRRRLQLGGKRLILLINSRSDRGSRTGDMLGLADGLAPAEIWLMGSARHLLRHLLLRRRKNPPPIRLLRCADSAALSSLSPRDVLFAIGNIAGPGKKLVQKAEKEGKRLV